MSIDLPVIAVIGGTGAEGFALARRWSRAGYQVIIGSRDPSRARDSADRIGAAGMENSLAARKCDIAVLTVPFAAQRATLEALRDDLQGKILVDVTVPLVPPRVRRVQLPEEGSAARIAALALGEGVQVVSAFQNVSAHHLENSEGSVDCDVLITGDAPAARARVVQLANAAGLRGIEAGPLANAIAAEALTSLLIWINHRHGVAGAGIRITGLAEDTGETTDHIQRD